METSRILTAIAVVCLLSVAAPARELLYNGIELPDEWPPQREGLKREQMSPPYLKHPPAVIPIDVGRQLLVDDFLIEQTDLKRTFHRPVLHKDNPVVTADQPWETTGKSFFAAPFHGGVYYDPADCIFKMWYLHSTEGDYYCDSYGYATSKDGVNWTKPVFKESRKPDEFTLSPKKGTNLVIKGRRTCTNTVILDHNAESPDERFKLISSDRVTDDDWSCVYRTSPDGIHWSEELEKIKIWGDYPLMFYNPFRRLWIYEGRNKEREPGSRIGDLPVYTKVGRCRSYMEAPSAREMVKNIPFNHSMDFEGDSVPWVGADDLDARHPDPEYGDITPQLYSLAVAPYESVMLGLFAIWTGPHNSTVAEKGIQKYCQIVTGFSRDGFYWDRPDRKPFIRPTWKEGTWNFGNSQPVGGCSLVVGDKLYIYFSGRLEDRTGMHGNASTGLAILRRDGFASMGSIRDEGYLTTRPVKFSGKYLYVNTDCAQGQLKVEVLDKSGEVIAPFTKDNCELIAVDSTIQAVKWKGGKNLSKLAGKPVRFRFSLRLGELYSFWVSPDTSGASSGYVGAGGPGFTGPVDDKGKRAYR